MKHIKRSVLKLNGKIMLWNGCINGLNRLQLVLNSYTLFCVDTLLPRLIFISFHLLFF